jgi:MFS family permease
MPIWAACVVFVIGTVLQTAAYSVAQFAIGRFIVGLGVGSAAMVVPLYIGELAPVKYRKSIRIVKPLVHTDDLHRRTNGRFQQHAGYLWSIGGQLNRRCFRDSSR